MSETEKIVWRNLIQANIAHKGHDVEGQGSPITQIFLDHYAKKYQEIWDQRKSKATTSEKSPE